jgi:WXG100 family type VII secretion target
MAGDGSQIAVNWGAMETGVSQFSATHAAINDIVTQLHSNLQSNLGDEWLGTASSGWSEVQQTWNQAQTRLAAIHSALTQAISTANSNYQEAEAANTRAWNT